MNCVMIFPFTSPLNIPKDLPICFVKARMLNRVIAGLHMLQNLVKVLIKIISEGLEYITVSIGIYQVDIFIVLLFQCIIIILIHV